MKKITKWVLQLLFIVVMTILAFSAKYLVRSCNGAVGTLVDKANEPTPNERINELAGHINDLCPIYFESWAKIIACELDNKCMILTIKIDDDLIDAYSEGCIILGVYQQFKNEISNWGIFEKDMEQTQTMISLKICNSNGEKKESIQLRHKDFFNSPLINYEQDKAYERQMGNIKAALEYKMN